MVHSSSIAGIIPARYASSRFPGKPLINIGGKTMIQRVYEQACQAKTLKTVIVATDDERIYQHVQDFGGNVVMTSPNHPSGTDRCYEAYTLSGMKDIDAIVNIQGDEPFIQPGQIDLLCSIFDSREVQLGTLVKKLKNAADLNNPNAMKVVLNKDKEALYFSRSPIPYLRNHPQEKWLDNHTFYKHIGIYAYRTDVLQQIVQLPPSSLELAESLEQLRWLENGYKIKVAVTDYESISVDTPEDLEKLTPFY